MKFYQQLKQITSPKKDIRLVAFIISILFSMIWILKAQPINIDGITYLQLAKLFEQQGLLAASQSHGHVWPFYPALIGYISHWLHLDLLLTAQIINTVFIGLTIVAFITITRTLGLSLTSQCIAALVILLFPSLANDRAHILRDFGFYCFMLFGLNSILHFYTKERYRWFLSWVICTLIAGLFRIEGWVFLLTVPLSCFFWQVSNKKTLLLKVFGSYVILLLAALVFYFLFLIEHHHSSLFTIFSADFIRVFQDIQRSYQHYTDLLSQYILSTFALRYAGTILISGVIGIIFITIIKTMLPFHLIFSGYGWITNSLRLDVSKKCIFTTYVVSYIIILFGFTFQHLFLTDRYVTLLCLILFLPIAPAIENFYIKYYKHLNPKYFAGYVSSFIVICIFVYAAASLFHIGVNKHYYLQGSKWVNQHTPKNSTVYMSDPRLTFYVKRAGTQFPKDFPYGYNFSISNMLHTIKKENFNYGMVFSAKDQIHNTLNLAHQVNLRLVKTFKNNRGDALFIFKNLNLNSAVKS